MKPAFLTSLTVVAVVAALAALTTPAHADDVGTLVVVTPNAPVIVTTGAARVPAADLADEPGPPPARAIDPPADPDGAPHNADWRDVSHINGRLVPVGERGDYLFTQKKTNLAANPLAAMFGYYDGSASFVVSSNVAIATSVTAWNLSYSHGYQAAVSAPIYFRRAFSGPFLEPGLVVRSTTSTCCYDLVAGARPDVAADAWAGPEVLFGWHWTFDSGLNIVTASGVARRVLVSNDDGRNAVESVGYFRVGYAF
jgi:hypothetical protein